jgi:hypothetical protein
MATETAAGAGAGFSKGAEPLLPCAGALFPKSGGQAEVAHEGRTSPEKEKMSFYLLAKAAHGPSEAHA